MGGFTGLLCIGANEQTVEATPPSTNKKYCNLPDRQQFKSGPILSIKIRNISGERRTLLIKLK